jgi:hypothetical protein
VEPFPRTFLRDLFREKDSLETLPPDGIPGGRASLRKEEFPGRRPAAEYAEPFALRLGTVRTYTEKIS